MRRAGNDVWRRRVRRRVDNEARVEEAPNLAETVLTERVRTMLARRLAKWRAQFLGFFTQLMLVCAFCGKCGWDKSNFKTVQPVEGERYGPAAAANFLVADRTISANGHWYKCSHCVEHDCARKSTVAVHPPVYARLVIAAHPLQVMLMSFLSTAMSLKEWVEGFTHGRHGTSALLDNPLLSWLTIDQRVDVRVSNYIMDILRSPVLFDARTKFDAPSSLHALYLCAALWGCRTWNICVGTR
ncbi:hypothetical protein HaLaN_30738, partial [Haematococcus lacustris]